MTDKKNKSDYAFAQRLCVALRNIQEEVIEKLSKRFHRRFLAFAKNRLRTLSAHYEHDALSVMNKYWIELSKGDYICKYEGRGTLENYLMRRLKARIIDKKRKMLRTKEDSFSQVLVNPGDDRPEDEQIDAAIYKNNSQGRTPDQQLASEQLKQILYESLFELKTKYPRDADYIKMYLDGMTYKEMAQHELASCNPDEETVRKRTNTIKVRFTRKETGSRVRYEKILVRNMEKYGIDARNLPLDGF